ncbi:carboxylating.nicotinate-nucleotide diphosphorylase, partial [Candidatus Micrarchaeota archaeon]|nr:carboxylating.nicotinate-nucleotide diphosphorylase [Candidatus Micrarchaeota archaeon]
VHPGLGESEKRAVSIGGGLTHRLNLSDGYLIKDNHVKSVEKELGISRYRALGIAIERVMKHRAGGNRKLFVEVEVWNLAEALLAARKDVNAILIDNRKPNEIKEIVTEVRKANSKVIIEASGGIKSKNIAKFLATGVDFVSMSELTLASKPVDISLELV